MCRDPIEVNRKGSLYFLGYGVGIIFFFLPDLKGRRGSMKYILPIYSIAHYMTVFPKNLEIRALGLFLQGIFHLKVSLSYTHMLELVEEKNKAMASTLITCFDSASLIFACSFYLYV